MKNKLHIVASVLVVASLICEVLVIIGSWIITTFDSGSSMQSLLTAEGVRWYIGNFAHVLGTPLLIWILLCGCAYGIVKESDVVNVISRLYHKQSTEYIERIALQAACVVGIIIMVCIFLLVFGPHTVLLSATGTVWDSSFTNGMIPITAFLFAAIGITYGYFSSKFKGVTTLFDACIKGVVKFVPVLVLYLFLGHLYMTVRYIFN